MRTRRKTGPRFFRIHHWLAPAASFVLVSCGEKAAPPAADSSAPPAPPPETAPAENVVTLPPSGAITTSASTPSTPATRQLTSEEQTKVLNLMIDRLKDKQARGLGTGTVRVNGAWNYDGYSYLSPNPAAGIPARMVAVDVTVEGHTTGFDPDDIEIVDGVTLVSYGSDPHITFLKGPGEIIGDADKIPVAPAPTRMLLIYAFPKGTTKFTLYYWGKNLLKTPMTFEASGWGLPYPEKEAPAAAN